MAEKLPLLLVRDDRVTENDTTRTMGQRQLQLGSRTVLIACRISRIFWPS